MTRPVFEKVSHCFIPTVVIWILTASQANAEVLITPTSVTLDAGTVLYSQNNLINNSGLSGAADINNYMTITHGGSAPGNSWVTGAAFPDYYTGGGTPPVMRFDLGGPFAITDVVGWNYSVPGNAARQITLSFSNTGTGGVFVTPNAVEIPQAAGPSHKVPLGTTLNADAVRIVFDSNWVGFGAGGDRVGLNELKLIGTPLKIATDDTAWTDANTWINTGVPSNTDRVLIGNHTVSSTGGNADSLIIGHSQWAAPQNGDGTLNVTGTLNVANDLTFGADGTAGTLGISGAGQVNVGGNINLAGDGTFDIGPGNVESFANNISGGGSLTKTGDGTLTLSGNNTHSGGTTLNSGVLALNNNTALGTGTLTLSGGAMRTNGNRNLANDVFVTGGTTTDIINGGSGDMIYAGDVTGTGTLVANSGTSRSVWLQGDGSGFAGEIQYTNVNNGTNLRLGGTGTGSNGLTNGSDWSDTNFVFSGSAGSNRGVNWNGAAGTTVQLGAISGDGRIGLSNSANWQIGALDTDTTFAGTIEGGSSSLTKVGAGILTLSGNNTYGGTTTVNAGTIKIGNKNALGQHLPGRPVSQVVVNSGGTVDFNGVIDALYGYTIAGSGVGGNGALVNNSSGIGNHFAQASNILLSNNASIGGTGDWALLTSGYNATSLDLDGNTLTKVGNNTIGFVSTTTTAGTVNVANGTLAFGATTGGTGVNGSATAFTLNNTAGANLSVVKSSSVGSLAGGGTTGGNVSLANGTTLTVGALGTSTSYAGVISGGGGLAKTGGGILTLSGANSFSGGTIVDAGTIRIGNKNALGQHLPGRPVSQVVVNSGGTVDFNGVIDALYGYTIAGSGVGGNGALVNNSSGIGNNFAQASNILLSDNASIGGTGNWALLTSGYNATSLDLDGNTLTKVGNNTIGFVSTTTTAGTVNVANGTLALGATTGGTGVNGSATAFTLNNTAGANLSVVKSSSVGSLAGGGTTGGNVLLANGTTLTVGALGSNTSYSGVISGGGNLEKTGGGTMTLDGANTYTGNTVVNGGGVLALTGSLENGTIEVSGTGSQFLQSSGQNNITGSGPNPHLIVGSGANYTLDGGVLDFQDNLVGALGESPSTMLISGTFNFNEGTLIDVTTINPSGGTGGFTQNGGDFVVGRNATDTAPRATNILGSFTQLSGALHLDIFGSMSDDIDMLIAEGDITLGGDLEVDMTNANVQNFVWYNAVKSDGTITFNGNFNGGVWQVLNGPDGSVLQVAIPEPNSVLLWGLLAMGLAAYARRRRMGK